MRLIDADELYDKLADRLTWLMGYGDEVYLTVGSTIRNVMDEHKTAYDIDKVVEQLKGLHEGYKCTDNEFQRGAKAGAHYVLNRAIEIVNGGGVNE